MIKKGTFVKDYPFEKRKLEAERILDKFPDRLPIIVELADNSQLPELDKYKYLVPKDLTVGQFQYVIRKRLKLSPEKAIYMFFNNTLASTSDLVKNVYEAQKSDDGFVYALVSGKRFCPGRLGNESA